MLDTPTAPPKFQIPASPPVCLVFSSPLKTTSEHMLSAIPNKLITLPAYVSSSSKTPQPPQLKFQPPSSISLPLLTTLKSPCTPTFPYSPTQIVHPLSPVPPPTSRHHLVPHPPSKALPATPSLSLCVAQGLLIHLFLTLLISKTPGSDSRHFLFSLLKNENKEEVLTGGIFWIFNLIENKYITEATVSGCSMKSALKQV